MYAHALKLEHDAGYYECPECKKKNNPQADKLVAICKALDMSLVDLLCDEEEADRVTPTDYILDEKHIIEVFRNSDYETKRRLLRYFSVA